MSATTETIADYQPLNVTLSGNNNLTFAISTNGWKFAAGFIPSESFTLAAVAFSIGVKTGTPVAYTITIETDNGSGRPSGTLAWAGATTTLPAGAVAGFTAELTLTTPGIINIGTIYHMVITPATDPASTNYISCRMNSQFATSSASPPEALSIWSSTWNGTSWSNGSGPPVFVLVSNDVTPKRLGQPFDGTSASSLTNTNWFGVKFKAPDNMTVWSMSLEFLVNTGANVTCYLLDSSNNILASSTLPTAYWVNNSSRVPHQFSIASPVTLVQGNIYRVVAKDDNSVQRMDRALCSVSGYGQIVVGPDFVCTAGTSADGTTPPSSWTDTPDSATFLGLKANAVTAGSSSGRAPGILQPNSWTYED